MKTPKLLIAAVVGCMSSNLAAQPGTAALAGNSDAAQRLFDGGFQADPDTVWDLASVQVQPEFPGGMDAMYKYMATHTQYPDDAVRNGTGGKVFLEFVVEKDGHVDRVKVRRGVMPSIDAEAVRMVRAMPVWSPGRMDEKPVAVRFTLPINFVPAEDPPPAQEGDR